MLIPHVHFEALKRKFEFKLKEVVAAIFVEDAPKLATLLEIGS